jgi:hypothetical protein
MTPETIRVALEAEAALAKLLLLAHRDLIWEGDQAKIREALVVARKLAAS